MAITADKSPYKLTAVGDDLQTVFQQGNYYFSAANVCKYKLSAIHVVAGASGVCTLLDKNGGEVIYQSKSLNAGDEAKFEPAHPIWMDGCYVQALPASSTVFLYVC